MNTTDPSLPATDCRSALYMPASKERVLAKGASLAADAIIIDLEDSVAPQGKQQARLNAIEALQNLDYGRRIRAIRVNAADTAWHADDVAAAVEAAPDAIVLPKVDCASDVIALSETLDKQSGTDSIALWAMMESPAAILNAAQIAATRERCPRLSVFMIGNNDLARASNMPVTSDRTFLIPWLMQLVAVAHAHGLTLLDGVYNDFANLDGFRAECQQAVAMGMHGKTLIHPSQIPLANEVFAPSSDDIQQAEAIVEAFARDENAGLGVLQINGKMVERLHLHMAEKVLRRARLFGEEH